MATAAQVLANRENAQLSTGPKTEEGRAICSRNAVRHNLTARGLIVIPGQEDAFAQLEDGLRLNLSPVGDLEEVIFKRVLECAWNLERCRLAEARLYDNSADPGVDPLLDDQNEAKYARIQKYARQNENSMLKCMRELGRLQTEVQFRHKVHPLTQEEVDDHELFAQTPHDLSAVCNYQNVTEGANRHNRSEKSLIQKRAKKFDEDFMAQLDAFTAPPPLRRTMITEDAQIEDEGLELAADAA